MRGKSLKTRILAALAAAPEGLCMHRLQDKFDVIKDALKFQQALEKLESKHKIWTSLGNCTRVPENHTVYNIATKPEKKKKRSIKTVTTVVEEQKGPEKDLRTEDLSGKTVEQLSEEIFSRCKEIMRRLYGGSWKFQG